MKDKDQLVERLKGMAVIEREAFLNDNAYEVQPMSEYVRPLTPEEISTTKEEFAEGSATLHLKEEAFKEVKKVHKVETDAMES